MKHKKGAEAMRWNRRLVLPIFWTVVTVVFAAVCCAGIWWRLIDELATAMFGIAAIAAAVNAIGKWIGYIEFR